MESKACLKVDPGAARLLCPESHAKHLPTQARREDAQLVSASGAMIEDFGSSDAGYRL